MTQCHDTYQSDPLSAAHMPILVRDVMTAEPTTVEPATGVKEIAHLLLEHDVRAVPVVDIGDLLVGVVSEVDIVGRASPSGRHPTLDRLVGREDADDQDGIDRAHGVTAGEIMSSDVISCAPDEPVSIAARRMLSRHVRMMPVVEGGRLVGVLSRHDILRVFDRPDSEIRTRIAQLLANPLWAPEGSRVHFQVVDGMVHLSGTVRYPSDVHTVASLIGAVPGVVGVRQELSAERPAPEPSS